MFPRMLIILAAAGYLLSDHANYSFAHDERDKEREEAWNPVSAGPVATWTAPLCGRAKFVIQPFFFYNNTRGVFDSDGRYNSLPGKDYKHQFQEQLFAQYGLTDRLEIDAQTVYQENFVKQDGSSAHAVGFGDSYLFMRYCAIEEEGWIPHISGLAQLKMPTGKYQKADPEKKGADLMGAPTGGGSWDPGFGLILTKKLKPFVFHADAVYSLPQQVRVNGVKTRYANYFNCDFGAEYFLPKGFNLMCETNFIFQPSGVNSFAIAPGIGWSNDKIQTLLAYQRVMAGTNTDANDSMIFTFVYTF